MYQDYSLLKRNFLLSIAALLVCSAVAMIFEGSIAVFYVAVAATGLLGIYLLLLCMWNVRQIGLGHIYGAAILLAYCFGALSTVISLYFQDLQVTDLFDTTIEDLMVALAIVVAVASVLLLLSTMQQKKLFDFVPHSLSPATNDLFIPILTSLTMLASYAMGIVGFQGLTNDTDGSISSIGSIATALAIPSAPYCVYMGLNARKDLKVKFLLLGLVIFCLLVPLGRRVVLYSAVEIIMAAKLAGWTISWRSRKVQAFIVVGLAGLWFATRFFYCMRLARYQMGADTPLYEILPQATNILFNPGTYQLDAQISENATSRTFILEYLALIIDRVGDVGGMAGEMLWFNFRLAIPAAFDTQKWQVVDLAQEEEVLHPHLNLPVWDAANSVFTTGAGDLYIFGMFLYPILFLGMFSLLVRFVSKHLPWQQAFFVSFLVINEFLNIETTVSSYFTTSRNAILVIGVLKVVQWLRQVWLNRNSELAGITSTDSNMQILPVTSSYKSDLKS